MTSATLEERLSRISATLELHTEQDNLNFEKLSAKLDELDAKIDSLLIREARRDGEFSGMKKSAVTLAGLVSFLVSVGAFVVQAYLR